jgi:hypothetical protein
MNLYLVVLLIKAGSAGLPFPSVHGGCGKAFSVAPSFDSNFPSRPRKLKLIRLVIFSQARVNTTDIHPEE